MPLSTKSKRYCEKVVLSDHDLAFAQTTALTHHPRFSSLRIIRLLLPIEFNAGRNSVILARKNIVLSQRISFPVIGAKNSPQIGMPVEDDPEHVERLALVPVRGRPK